MVGQKAKTSASDNNINRMGCIWEASHVQSVTHMMTIHSYARIQSRIISAIHGKVRTEVLPLRRVQLYRIAILILPFASLLVLYTETLPIKKEK